MNWQTHILNNVDVKPFDNFTAIIGANPSKGARSPILWNAAFGVLGKNVTMVPFDIGDLTSLKHVLVSLDAESSFAGGAVTMPFKESVASWLGKQRITPEALAIGAVNCLYRGLDGRLNGTNTDGQGALVSLKTVIPNIRKKSTLLIGPGGAGKAVAAYLSTEGADLTVASRNPESLRIFAELVGCKVICMPVNPEEALSTDILINCTPIGSADRQSNMMPVCEDFLSSLSSDAVVFDIIYNPPETPLLKASLARGLKVLNGKGMNLEQAVAGFSNAFPDAAVKVVRQAMLSIV